MNPRPAVHSRILVAATLVLAIVVSLGVALNARARGPRRAENAEVRVEGMEEAHAAAGVATSELEVVQSSFHQLIESRRAEVAANPDNRALVLELAHTYHDGHRPAEAIEHYRTAIRLDPSEGQAYYDLAAAHAELGRWDAARDVLMERLELVPDDGVALYDLGAARANLGDSAGARAAWNRLLELPVEPAVRAQAVRALAQLGGLDPP